MIKGEAVTIYMPSISYDSSKDEVITYSPVDVDNVLFGRPTTEQIEEVMRLYSIRAQYTLGIPKVFTQSLRGCYVVRKRDVAPTGGVSGATGETGTPDGGTIEPTKYWVAGDPQPLPIENCPTQWNREAVAGWIDG